MTTGDGKDVCKIVSKGIWHKAFLTSTSRLLHPLVISAAIHLAAGITLIENTTLDRFAIN
ncbi:hypothetical protein [Aeromonas jandaei]|uniref:hypothetical protein n=1 Tax=Aeromonas jandaei TaxID=650 RepID=UPI00398727D6